MQVVALDVTLPVKQAFHVLYEQVGIAFDVLAVVFSLCIH